MASESVMTFTKKQRLEVALDTFASDIVLNVQKFEQTPDAISYTRNMLVSLLQVAVSINMGDKRVL